MPKKYPAEVNDEGWPLLTRQLAERNGFALDEVDRYVFTQVRRRTIEKVMENLGQPKEKAPTIMDRWGYTGSGCIPMAFHHTLATQRFEPGALFVLVGSGVGYNQAGVALRLTDALLYPETDAS